MIRPIWCVVIAALLSLVSARVADAQLSWDQGAGTFLWGDFNNWNPNGDPNGDAILIGNLAAATNDTTLVDAAYIIPSLTITNGADVINSPDGGTTDFELQVSGATTISDAGSSITLYGGNPDGLDTGTLTINSGGDLILNSQQTVGTAVVEVDSGALTNNVGGLVSGNGRIDLEQSVAGVTTLFNNEGTLTATSIGPLISPPATTLQITATDLEARVDLDGAVTNQGIVNVNRNATLDINVPLSDGFGGDLNLAAGATLDVNSPWAINAGTVDVNTPGVIVGTAGPAAHLDGATITMSGGTLTLNDGLDGLVLDAAFTASSGAIANSGTITFNAATTIAAAVNFDMNGGESKLVVNSVVNVDVPDFDLDAINTAGNVTTINVGGNLDLDLGAGADEDFNHTININGGELDVTTADNTWSISGTGTINAGGGAVSSINGETLQITGTGSINVAANSGLDVFATTQITGAASFVIEADAVLAFNSVTYGNAAATFTGDGTLRKGAATINAPTTWNVAVVDLDFGTTTLNEDLTILATSIEETPDDGFDAVMTINDTFLLSVLIAESNTWTVDPAGAINYNGNATADSYLAGSDVQLNGTINHSGDGRIDARLDIGATGVVNINTAGEPLHLSGGDNTTNSNTIAGGTINGPGKLVADVGKALRGYGTINADIEFFSVAHLIADDGTLTVNGSIVSVSEIHVIGDDAVLDVTNPWNTNVAASVSVSNGELTGALITNDDTFGISGRGLVSAQVINNSRLRANNGGTLVFESPGNNNDWDGVGGTGDLDANTGDLELRDNVTFAFAGTVNVQAARRVYTNGFALDFQTGSALNLTAGTYLSTAATDFGGTMTVNAGGPSVLKAGGTATFETTSSTTLIGDLELESEATIVAVGAAFAGGGRLINAQERVLSPAGGATIDVLVENRGTHDVAGAAVGRNDVREYIQTETGTLNFTINGTGVGLFDRMFVDGQIELAGTMGLAIGGGYVPALGNMVTVISSLGGVIGEFDHLLQPAGLPTGLQFALDYQPQFVRLMVVEQLAGDYNYDGVVDAADYTVWRNTLGSNTNLAADGNLNNMIDDDDYTVWKMHFGDVAGSGAIATNHTVPEPSGLILFAFCIVWTLFVGEQRCQRRISAQFLG